MNDPFESLVPLMDNNELLTMHRDITMVESSYRKNRERIELILRQRMEADGAKSIAHETLTCELVYPSPTYDQTSLRQLLELDLVPYDEMAKGYTPAHVEVKQIHVEAKWDMRQVKTWTKYGNAVKDVIAAAMIPGTPRLRIAPKKEDKA